VLIAPGFEEIEATTIIDILRRCGVKVTVTGTIKNVIKGANGIKLMPEKSIEETQMKNYDAVVLPGGSPGFENLRKDKRVLTILKEASASKKIIAAICAAPAVLSDAGVLKNKKSTIYPGMEIELTNGGGKPMQELVVEDGNILTSRGPATAFAFALKLSEKLVGKEISEKVRKQTLANLALK
jgi:4-methyl-5(b-hydroxyethyl)-thiazole monophosphate biosynthesis